VLIGGVAGGGIRIAFESSKVLPLRCETWRAEPLAVCGEPVG